MSFVKRYLIALDQYKLVAFTVFSIVLGGTFIVGRQPPPPPIYRATGLLSYNRPAASFAATTTQVQDQGQQLQEDTLLDNRVIGPVGKKLNLDPETFIKQINVKFPEKEEPPFIQVIYRDLDEKRAETILTELMQRMVEYSKFINTTKIRATINAINQNLPKVKQDLKLAEQKLETFVRLQGPALLYNIDGNLVKSIIEAQNQQRQLRLSITGVDAQIASLQQKLGLNPDQAYTSSALSSDPIIANIRTQILQIETQLNILGKELRPEHPNMIQLRQQKESYEQILSQRAKEVMGGAGVAAPLPSQVRQDSNLDPARQLLANSLVTLQTQRETLQQQLIATAEIERKLRLEYSRLPNKQLEQARLQKEYDLKQGLYDKMQASLLDAKTAEVETVSSLGIAQLPIVKAPEPNKITFGIIMAGGAGVGLIMALGVIFLFSSFDTKIYGVPELKALLKSKEVPLLGELPLKLIRIPNLGLTPILIQSDSPYLEYYERLRTTINRIDETNPIKVILLSSVTNQEGKTVCATNLAIASALAGKRTLLIEADLRYRSQFPQLWGANPLLVKEPLTYYHQLNNCTHLVKGIQNLHILPSPGPVRLAAAVLESSEFQRLLEDAAARFDLVILDAPPLSRCNDALILEPLCDGIILVTKPNTTQSDLLSEAIAQLNEGDTKFLGGIINGVVV